MIFASTRSPEFLRIAQSADNGNIEERVKIRHEWASPAMTANDKTHWDK
jgi:hypothetical protein